MNNCSLRPEKKNRRTGDPRGSDFSSSQCQSESNYTHDGDEAYKKKRCNYWVQLNPVTVLVPRVQPLPCDSPFPCFCHALVVVCPFRQSIHSLNNSQIEKEEKKGEMRQKQTLSYASFCSHVIIADQGSAGLLNRIESASRRCHGQSF